MRYELDENNAISIFVDGQEAPVVFQPTWPNGAPWGSGEAEAWAEQYILSFSDESADMPGLSPEQPTMPRPTAEEIAAYKRNQLVQVTFGELEDLIAAKIAEALAK